MNKKFKSDLKGVTVNGRPVSVTINQSQGKALHDALKPNVHRYHKPNLRVVEKRRPSPVKRYSRGAINQNYGKQAAIDACKATKSSSYVALLLLLTGKPIKSRDILDIYSACGRKVSGPTISGTLKRIASSPIKPLIKDHSVGKRITLQLREEAVGILPEDLRKLANRMNKYSKKEFLQAYPELECFYTEEATVPVTQEVDKVENSVVHTDSTEDINDSINKAIKKVEDVVTSAAVAAAANSKKGGLVTDSEEGGTLLRIAPIKLHFTFDFNINVNMNT